MTIKTLKKKTKQKSSSNYSDTKVKTRILLTNVSNRRYKQKDDANASFTIDILSSIVQNFNPIWLDRKLEIENERQYIKMMWDICLLHAFTRFIYLKDNFTIFSSPNFTYQKLTILLKDLQNKILKRSMSWGLNYKKTLKLFTIFTRCCVQKFTIEWIILEYKIKCSSNLFFRIGKQRSILWWLVQKLLMKCQLRQIKLS